MYIQCRKKKPAFSCVQWPCNAISEDYK